MNAHTQKLAPRTKKVVNSVAKKVTPRAAAPSSLATRLERAPAIVKARKLLGGWRSDGALLLKRHPGRAALGAFALGVALTKIARHV